MLRARPGLPMDLEKSILIYESPIGLECNVGGRDIPRDDCEVVTGPTSVQNTTEFAALKKAVTDLTLQGLKSIAASSFGMDGFGGGIAHYDPRKDALITELPRFGPAVDELKKIPAVQALFGANEAGRIALQFVFNSYSHAANNDSAEVAFERVWDGFIRELEKPTWTFAAVANIQNINCPDGNIDLFDGISIRGRSFEELERLLGWGPRELDVLTQDWMQGAGSSFILLLTREVPKTPENLLMQSDGTAYSHIVRALLALRLVAAGDVRIGRLFFARPSHFNVGIGGMQSSGFSVWHPGPQYILTSSMIHLVAEWYRQLTAFEQGGGGRARNVGLALRSFSSIYDRYSHQAEDRVLDAITALEALWKLDTELAFRLSFRTASLLGDTDDERESLYGIVNQYYKIRSKIVHGSTLNDAQAAMVHQDERIRDVVRRSLRGFVKLVNDPGEWSLARLDSEADVALLHPARRQCLRAAMGF